MITILYAGNYKAADGILISLLSMVKHTDAPLNVICLTMDLSEMNENFRPISKSFSAYMDGILKSKNPNSKFTAADMTEEFKKNLKDVIRPYLPQLCEDCQTRFEKNPLRLLDCKSPECQEVYAKPEIQAVIQGDFICEECSEHFNELLSYLDTLGIKYERNKLLVRGLDYYNRTVFEIKSNNLGSQNAVCGGGRYDSLVKNLGGEDTPAIGFAMGMERLASLLGEKKEEKLTAFVVSNNIAEAIKLTEELRLKGITCEFDLTNKKFVKQLEKASKVAKYAVILGEDEISKGEVTVKNLDTSEQKTVKRNNIVLN